MFEQWLPSPEWLTEKLSDAGPRTPRLERERSPGIRCSDLGVRQIVVHCQDYAH
jgi:hypothetical protein